MIEPIANRASKAVWISGAKGDEADLPKRRRALVAASGFSGACSRCEMMVGTTENQVACMSAASAQKRDAEKRAHIASEPPDTRAPMTVTQSPLM
jgi:hypothetical protein